MRSRKSSAAWCLVAVATVGLAQTQPPKADEKPASVEGEVRNSVSGLPVERAHVSLRWYKDGGPDKYGALTNAEGRFSIKGIPPGGPYQVTLDRVGFVAPLDVNRHPLTLHADEKRDNFNLKLVPVGAISGRVTDADGQPVGWISVEAVQGTNSRRGGMTDDRGQYRIGGLSPGKYRVRAVPQNMPVPPEIRTDGTTEVHYAATYHPGVVDEKGGMRVVVSAATDATGVDIRMVRTPIVRLAGKVSGMPEGQNAYVQVMPANGGQGGTQGTGVKADGSFEIWRPNPGKYNVRAMYNISGEMMASGAVEVEVGETDIDNIGLTLLAAEEIRGQLEFEDEGAKQGPQMQRAASSQGGSQAPAPRPLRRIMLRGSGSMGQVGSGDVSEDGAFIIAKVTPGKYRVTMQGYTGYVKSVRMGETTSEGPVLNLSQGSGGAAVTVTLSSAYGEISGTVRDDKGPVAGANVVAREASNPSMGMYAATTSQADGTYNIKSVAPGTYQLMVMDESETITSDASADDYDEFAEKVEVRPKETATSDLKVRVVK